MSFNYEFERFPHKNHGNFSDYDDYFDYEFAEEELDGSYYEGNREFYEGYDQ